MALSDPYATAANYRARYPGNGDVALLESDLKATSRLFERKMRRFFTKDTAAAPIARLLRGTGESVLCLDQGGFPGIATQTGLVVTVDTDDDGSFADETALVNGDLLILPLDAANYPEPRPWTEIELTSQSAIGSFPEGVRVQVTAEWGWPAVPDAIFIACIEFTAMRRGDSAYSTGRIDDLDRVETIVPQARAALRDLVRDYSRGPVVA